MDNRIGIASNNAQAPAQPVEPDPDKAVPLPELMARIQKREEQRIDDREKQTWD
jgi:hypothetical protein